LIKNENIRKKFHITDNNKNKLLPYEMVAKCGKDGR